MARHRTSRTLWPGVPRLHPTGAATARRGQEPRGPINGARVDNTDVNAIHCAQCGASIEDSTIIDTCWVCGTDNFNGDDVVF